MEIPFVSRNILVCYLSSGEKKGIYASSSLLFSPSSSFSFPSLSVPLPTQSEGCLKSSLNMCPERERRITFGWQHWSTISAQWDLFKGVDSLPHPPSWASHLFSIETPAVGRTPPSPTPETTRAMPGAGQGLGYGGSERVPLSTHGWRQSNDTGEG